MAQKFKGINDRRAGSLLSVGPVSLISSFNLLSYRQFYQNRIYDFEFA